MICTTVRNGVDCVFMKKSGCSYNGGSCRPALEQCKGCSRIINFDSKAFCGSVPDPSVKWKNDICNLATHVRAESSSKEAKINPLKASKRAKKG